MPGIGQRHRAPGAAACGAAIAGAPIIAEEKSPYRQIFRSTLIIGSASALNVLIGLVRNKLVALLLGPAGIGLIGLYTTLMTTAATVAQIGIPIVGPKQVAEAHASNDEASLLTVRRSLLSAAMALAVAGGAALWLLRAPLARWATGEPGHEAAVGWLALGLAATVLAAALAAIVQGMRRTGDLASISIFSALAATLGGVPAIWWLGEDGVILYVLAGPMVALLAAFWFVRRLPRLPEVRAPFAATSRQWVVLLRMGVPCMGAALVTTGIEFWLRIDVRHQLGIDAVGHFQASWVIAAQCVGFVLGAMAADYYPRLTAVMKRPDEAVAIINQQTEVALLLAGPALLLMIGFAPLAIDLLYSSEFAPAADLLRWQALAALLKVASWPLGFVMLAAGDGRNYFLAESAGLLVMALTAHLLMTPLGLEGAGIAYVAMYAVYLPIVYLLAVRRLRFAWTVWSIRTLACVLILATLVFVASQFMPDFAWVSSLLALGVLAPFGLRRLHVMGLGNMFTEIGGAAFSRHSGKRGV